MTAATASSDRDEALAAASIAERDVVRLIDLAEASPRPEQDRLLVHLDLARRRREAAEAAYLEALPEIALSRCPLTEAEVRVGLDTAGLNGPWWRAAAPLRRPLPDVPTLVSLTGALRLGTPIERTGFLVKPGPGVPYVLPPLLEHPRAAGVLSSVAIGAHMGYVVCYFAAPDANVPRANDWGTDSYHVRRDGVLAWGSATDEERDFDLAPWIRRGRLRWIAPGDARLVLRDEAAACPYLGIDGPREPQRIQFGRSW